MVKVTILMMRLVLPYNMDEKNVISYLSVKEPMRNMDQLHLTNHRLRTLSILTLESVINEEKKIHLTLDLSSMREHTNVKFSSFL